MTQRGKDWCILRTSGARTLRLADSLRDDGIEAWTPSRTVRRPIPGQRRELVLGRVLKKRDVAVPILATFVFADAERLRDLADLSLREIKPQPEFSVFRIGNRVPLLSDATMDGLRCEERKEADRTQAERDADSHAEAEILRIEAMKSEAARRRAFREVERQRREALAQARRAIKPGTVVVVDEHPAFGGVQGVTVSCVGPHTWVQLGAHTWKIDTWRLTPVELKERRPITGTAA